MSKFHVQRDVQVIIKIQKIERYNLYNWDNKFFTLTLAKHSNIMSNSVKKKYNL